MRVAGWPMGLYGVSPASATSGFAAGAASCPARAPVPATATLPETGLDTLPFFTVWPPIVVIFTEPVEAVKAVPASTSAASALPANHERRNLTEVLLSDRSGDDTTVSGSDAIKAT